MVPTEPRRRWPPHPRADERNFRWLWTGDVISQIGSQITLVALPFTAVTVLHASGGQIGVLQALYTLSFGLLALPVGAWVENRRKVPVILVTSGVCCVLACSVPLAAGWGALGMPQLYAVALLGGAATVISDIAKISLVPRLVTADRLATANSRLNAGIGVAVTAGPGFAGWLTALVGAPNALLVDGASYLLCMLAIGRLRRRAEPRIDRGVSRRPTLAEIREGLRAVFAKPALRGIAIHTALYNGGMQLVVVALFVHLVSDLRLGGGAYGIVLVVGGAGAIGGTLAAPLLIRALGYGKGMLGSLVVSVAAAWMLPMVHGGRTATIAFFAAAMLLTTAGPGVCAVLGTTVRQQLTPARLHARMNASFQLMEYGAMPLGALAGGWLVDMAGATATLWAAPAVLLAGTAPLATRAVLALGRRLTPADDAPGAVDSTAGDGRDGATERDVP